MNKKSLIFMLAVAAQVLILISMPLSKAYTRATGRSVLLKVVPVDPYSIMRGYHVILGYDINRVENFINPADQGFENRLSELTSQFSAGETVFAIVEDKGDGLWHPVELVKSPPSNLPANQIAIRGKWSGSMINYGIEEFYIPEAKRTLIEQDFREHPSQARVEVKVDASGNPALVRLIIEDRIYE